MGVVPELSPQPEAECPEPGPAAAGVAAWTRWDSQKEQETLGLGPRACGLEALTFPGGLSSTDNLYLRPHNVRDGRSPSSLLPIRWCDPHSTPCDRVERARWTDEKTEGRARI